MPVDVKRNGITEPMHLVQGARGHEENIACLQYHFQRLYSLCFGEFYIVRIGRVQPGPTPAFDITVGFLSRINQDKFFSACNLEEQIMGIQRIKVKRSKTAGSSHKELYIVMPVLPVPFWEQI